MCNYYINYLQVIIVTLPTHQSVTSPSILVQSDTTVQTTLNTSQYCCPLGKKRLILNQNSVLNVPLCSNALGSFICRYMCYIRLVLI